MAKTHEIFKTPLFFQFLSVAQGTPPVHRAIQSQEIDEPFRKAMPWVIRIPVMICPYFYRLFNHRFNFIAGVTVQFNSAIAVGWWRKTGYEEHEALSHALNLNEEHADNQATDFETAANGLTNESTDLGKSAEPFTVRGNDVSGPTGTDDREFGEDPRP